MKSLAVSIVAFSFLVLAYMGAWQGVHRDREKILSDPMMDYTLPSKVTGPMSLRFKGLASDFLFLKTTTFIGEQLIRSGNLEDAHGEYIFESVDAISDLDPHFWDPYYLSFMILSWELDDFERARILMEKAMAHREKDWRPPYYIGFGCYYFKGDNECAAEYMGRAALMADAPSHVVLLGSRFQITARPHRAALLFLKQMLLDTRDTITRMHREKRILVLERLDLLEGAVRRFHAEYQRLPETLHELTEKGILDAIPEDPYGGEFYILENGRVFTSSALRDGP